MTTWLYTLLVFLRRMDAANPFFFPPTHVVPSTSSCLHRGHHHRHSHHLVTSSAPLPVRSTSLFCGRARTDTHTGTHAHAHLETVKVSTCTGREGATSPPLSLSLGITAELSCRGSRGREKTQLQLPISETQADRPAD